jgi:uncharacterized OB-fold protein
MASPGRIVIGPCAEPELPPVDAVTQGWWDATRERRLVLQSCGACGAVQHYPRALCTSCGATDQLGWREVSGNGTVDSFSVVHRGLPGFEAPYVVARVRLAEGPILMTNLVDADVESWSCDDAVAVAWQPLSDGRHLPLFAPA